jgi:hypothetical protein
MDRNPAPQIGNAEVGCPVAAVSRPQQAVKNVELIDRQKTSVAGLPAIGHTRKPEHANFADIARTHDLFLL